eukprot:CAMPEP_0202416882 /NCGR_PEP_ID=MMETSP1128-20130828/41027_1 /ASSEMBLY_ACC=CAM_ASM_000463 /TAXON_ID=3047 /ORGANISM="Dunaliella tertiolecta, Strain CCMP1320" /LENGTH=211 /DNA_ID=CAMNT_0049024019 /DNA_START=115 /DNA_END=747 /DNA_ORIENTATION=-
MAYCQQVKGLLLVSPEERLSLQLKRDELWDLIHGVCAELDKLSTMPYKDVIDENDVMLPLRDVEITVEGAAVIRDKAAHCQQVGGLLLVAPEHGHFLELKHNGLWNLVHAVCAELDELSAMPYIDIIDENDVILHHRYQLVYASGSQRLLPSLEQRAIAIQAMLLSISNMADTRQSVLSKPGMAVWTDAADPSRAPGSFCGLRLLQSDALD